MKPDEAQILLCPGRARVRVSRHGGGYYLMILVWRDDDDEVFGYGVAKI